MSAYTLSILPGAPASTESAFLFPARCTSSSTLLPQKHRQKESQCSEAELFRCWWKRPREPGGLSRPTALRVEGGVSSGQSGQLCGKIHFTVNGSSVCSADAPSWVLIASDLSHPVLRVPPTVLLYSVFLCVFCFTGQLWELCIVEQKQWAVSAICLFQVDISAFFSIYISCPASFWLSPGKKHSDCASCGSAGGVRSRGVRISGRHQIRALLKSLSSGLVWQCTNTEETETMLDAWTGTRNSRAKHKTKHMSKSTARSVWGGSRL